MLAEISIEKMPEARAKLAAMPRQEVEAVCKKALIDAGALAVGIFEMARLIGEAQISLKNPQYDAANLCLDQAISISGNPTTSVPTPGVTP